MLRNFIVSAIRNLWRFKSYTILNGLGLAIGMASVILIFTFVQQELSFDKFHANAERIYRLYIKGKIGDQKLEMAWTAVPTCFTFVDEVPGISNGTRLEKWDNVLIRYEDKSFLEDHLLWADSTFFEIFSFNLLEGDRNTALDEPYSVVISIDMARKYFGEEDPMGKVLNFFSDSTHYRVTGIMAPVPGNSHFYFDFVASFHSTDKSKETYWLNHNLMTYFLLDEGADPEEVRAKFEPLIVKYLGPEIQQFFGLPIEEWGSAGNNYGMYLQPLTDIHLNANIQHGFKPANQKKYLYIFSLIALFIIVIGSINFMNLSTARSAARSKEVGIRKVVGSKRNLLIWQFICEFLLLSFIALLLAILITELALPKFNQLISMNLTLGYLTHWYLIPGLIGLAVVVGFLSGSYPAFFLSSFRPVAVLSGETRSGSRKSLLRNILVILQFSLSIGIILGTLVVTRQLDYLLNKDLGFDKEQIIVIRRASVIGKDHIEAFKQEIKKVAAVEGVTASTMVPGLTNNNTPLMVEGRPPEENFLFAINRVDYDFPVTYGMQLDVGRFHSNSYATDTLSLVINEAAVKEINLDDPLKNRLYTNFTDDPESGSQRMYFNIIGVVKDFHFESLHSPVRPYLMIPFSSDDTWIPYVSIRLDVGDIQKSINDIELIWKEFTNNQPFEYYFLDQDFAQRYDQEQRTRNLFSVFSLLAVFIACLGLFGLSAFTAEQRTKEIGIRKVMGATIPQIMIRLSKETLIMVCVSAIIAWPVTWYFMKKWLEGFAYRIELPLTAFAISLILALAIALFTVSFQAFAAASRNPAESLRYE